MKSFLTGSHVYGRPTAKSNIDLVIMAEDTAISLLQDQSESLGQTIRFGKLNIILCQSQKEYDAWKTTTERLEKVHRETGAIFDKIAAHAEFEKDREKFGIEYKGDSGQDFSPEESIEKQYVPGPKRQVIDSSNPFEDLL